MPHLWYGHVQNSWWQIRCRSARYPCKSSLALQPIPGCGLSLYFMSQQLAYVILTPYSLHKSRTGGILSRLITRTGLELAAMRMFAPSAELVNEYASTIVSAHDSQDRRIQEMLRDYMVKNLSPDPVTGIRKRVMMLLFRGDEAVRKVRSVVGNLNPERRVGESIRDTYGDLIMEENGHMRYFEPAVFAAPNTEEA